MQTVLDAPGTDTDAVALLNALAHAGRPLIADFLAGPYALRRTALAHFTLCPRLDVRTDRQMNWVHPANHTELWRNPGTRTTAPLQRDVLSDQDTATLFQASYEGAVSTDPEKPTAATVAGLLDAGLLVRADHGTAVLADDVRYSLRLTDDDSTAY